MARKRDRNSGDLFIDPSGQLKITDKSAEQQAMERKVECLGKKFASEEERRTYYTDKLRQKLADPEFRKTPGFPGGTDEDILRLSDPPYYTACPNPFLADFLKAYGKPYDPAETYCREPFAVDVSEGKTDQLYKAHAYHTKVPHLAIVPSILHYTKPGDIVLDGFAGSGMTGVAAQWCGAAPAVYRKSIEEHWKAEGRGKPEWGARKVILGDLGPAATFIAANYNLPFNVQAFAAAAQRILDEVEAELGWMYETLHTDGKTKGRINYTVWSEVFSCPDCSGEVSFVEEALDEETKRVHEEFPCPHCAAQLTKDNLERSFETGLDPATRTPWKRIRMKPAFINYSVGKKTFEKVPDAHDQELLRKIGRLPFPAEVPIAAFPLDAMYHGSRLRPKGFTHVHHMFLPRASQALTALWRRANSEPDSRLRNILLFFFEQAIWGMSILNRYKTIMHGKTTSSNVNQYLSGVYYVPSQHSEVSPWYNLQNRLDRLTTHAFARQFNQPQTAIITTGDCASIPLRADSIDYVFTDPPFGANIYYADLNFLVESWHRVITSADEEAIVDPPKHKGIHEYQDLMRRCFEEYHRVLKPGRWMTVVFSNSSNAIWRAIQEAMGTAGFVVADVRTLDKKQGSYRQVTSSALKQDLVISAYKPTEALTRRFSLGKASAEAAWAFITEHLRNLPVFVGSKADAEVVSERTLQMLHDRMVAFFVQRGIAVPMSSSDFLVGLEARYPKREGMYFLPDQVVEYDRKRITVTELRQLELFVTDEASATQWLRQQLSSKPQTIQELRPQFMQQIQAWAKHEKTLELREILTLSFLCYDGSGPVPGQIHGYLSTNFKELRKLAKDDPALQEKAKDRWYAPDPKKEGDLEKVRLRALLKDFEEYRASTDKKLRQVRVEAVRAGFKFCYDNQDYRTIVSVAAKLPEVIFQEDQNLYMYYDVANMRLGDQ